jgi:hypothetical protein
MRRRPPQHQPAAAAPERADEPGGEPGEHRDVEPRDRHQVCDAGGSKDVPVGAVDRVLVARDQRCDHAGQATIGHPLQDRIAHRFARPLEGIAPAPADTLGACCTGAHIAAGLHALLPQAQLVVEAVRIEIAVRRLEAHRQAPALARTHRAGRGGALGAQRIVGRAAPEIGVVGIPAERDALRHARHATVMAAGPARRLDIEEKAHGAIAALRHLRNHAHHLQVASLERGRQRIACIGGCAPARETAAGHRAEQQHGQGRAPPSAQQQPRGRRDKQQSGINSPAPQRSLLQLQRSAQHRAGHGGKERQAARLRARRHATVLDDMQQSLPDTLSVAR